MDIKENQSKGIQSIEVGVDILKKVASSKLPLSITEIATLCETSKSRIHRYLISFVRTGMLTRDKNAKYTLGPALMMLGLNAYHRLNITDIASPHLINLKDKLNETVALAIWGDNGPFFIFWEESNKPINIGLRAGSQVSLTESAAGQALSAYLPADLIENQIAKELRINSISEKQFQESIDIVKDNGYSFVRNNIVSGISAIASPIFDQSGEVIAALTVIGLETSLDCSEDSESVRALKETAKIISNIFGANNIRNN